ncbi:MAG: hypothetical protein KAG18_03175 [Sinobacterium sp.]|nr:hypothetical protein [Sinobacterium sp.]
MSTQIVNLRDFSSEIGKFTEYHISDQKQIIAKAIVDSFATLVESGPMDTGLYAQSWDMVESESSVILGNYAPHAAIIEDGARPYMPPIGPLLAWAKRVLQDGQTDGYSSHVWALAKYTQAKIAEHGQKPKKIMENHIPVVIAQIKRILGEI